MSLALRIHPIRGPLRRWAWEHPQSWSLVLAAGAWAAMVPHGLHAGHHEHRMSALQEAQGWMLMVGAMMLPLLGEQLKEVAFRNFPARRHAAMALFLLGYLVPWGVMAAPVAWMREQPWGHHPVAPVVAFAVGALWVLTPAWERAHRTGHALRPLAPTGWAWTRDTSRLGMRQGVACAATCLPIMLGCALSGHALYAMLGGFILGLFERRSFWPPRRRLAAGCVLLALWAGVLAA